MRILIHSNAPWVPSGYGKQCALLAKVLRELGHDVCVSAISGLNGGPIEWDGVPVFPHGRASYGVDTLLGHADLIKAQLVITLMDFYQLFPIAEQLRELNVAAWLPIDTATLGRPDREVLQRSGARPIAMSDHGAEVLAQAGWTDPLYAPHMHDVTEQAWQDAEQQRKAYRLGMGIEERFVIGICAANNDQFRKGFPEQFEAFRRFRKDHPEALLRVHTLSEGFGGGVNLQQLAHDLGLEGAVQFTDSYAQTSGGFDDSLMLDWLSTLDVLSNCSYGEGFGVPMLEAQAMGTPVIATRAAAMADVGRAQWLVEGEPFWNYVHQAWWTRPYIGSIFKAYGKAHRYAASKRLNARAESADYHREQQVAVWEQLLKELEPRG